MPSNTSQCMAILLDYRTAKCFSCSSCDYSSTWQFLQAALAAT